MLKFRRLTKRYPAQGSNPGGIYKHSDGTDYYLKRPNSRRQGYNEIMASRFYKDMDFDAVQYQWVDNGMIASRWREGLPKRSDPDALRESDVVQEAFIPSALLGNWDVIGLEYDNVLYNPDTMDEPVFLDFGGSFDTRAMGGEKPYEPDNIMALDGFTDPAINRSATRVFETMTFDQWIRSGARIGPLIEPSVKWRVEPYTIAGQQERIDTILSRKKVLQTTWYDDVF